MATIFDLLREAGEDDNTQQETTPTEDNDTIDVDDTTDETQNNDQDEDVADDEFDIDTSLDDEGGDDTPPESGVESDSSSNDSSMEDDEDEEPIEANTDIFSSLTAEEQTVKIKELKNQYNQLYMSCDKILERLNNLDPGDDIGVTIINRFSSTLFDIKTYISEYITDIFGTKSFVENDIMLNRFLMIIDSMTNILDKYVKSKEKEQ
jgi:hypothetical protein